MAENSSSIFGQTAPLILKNPLIHNKIHWFLCKNPLIPIKSQCFWKTWPIFSSSQGIGTSTSLDAWLPHAGSVRATLGNVGKTQCIMIIHDLCWEKDRNSPMSHDFITICAHLSNFFLFGHSYSQKSLGMDFRIYYIESNEHGDWHPEKVGEWCPEMATSGFFSTIESLACGSHNTCLAPT